MALQGDFRSQEGHVSGKVCPVTEEWQEHDVCERIQKKNRLAGSAECPARE